LIHGPEHDVLTRYVTAAFQVDADYIVRVTGDCPLISSTSISKVVNTATKNGLDFVTNASPKYRTTPDGMDVEVLSKRALAWLHNNALSVEHREHVTKKLYEKKEPSLSYGFIINDFDLSHIKISIDTKEEFDNMVNEMNKVKEKINKITNEHGPRSVFKFSGFG